MLASTETFLLAKIQACIHRDEKLFSAIKSLELVKLKSTGYRLVILSTPEGSTEVNEKLVWLVRTALSVAVVNEVDFNGDRLSIQSLARVSPSINTPIDGALDKELRMSQKLQKHLLYDTAIEALLDDYSVFLLSLSGRCLDVQFRKGSQPLLSAKDLLNKQLHEVVGTATAETILDCLKLTQRTRLPQTCSFDILFDTGERRWYCGKAYPSGEEQPLLFTVKLIKSSHGSGKSKRDALP